VAVLRCLFAAVLALAVAGRDSAATAAPPSKPIRIGFVAPLDGPLAEVSEAYLEGARGVSETLEGREPLGERTVEIVPIDDRDDPKTVRTFDSRIRKGGLLALIGAPSGRTMPSLVALARKLRLPLVLVTPWVPPFSLEASDPVFHFSPSAVDQGIAAARYGTVPLRARRAAALHDGSPPSIEVASAFLRNLPPSIESAGAHLIPETGKEIGELAKKLAAEPTDLLYLCGDAASARRAAAAVPTGPRLLLADGLASPGVCAALPESARLVVGAHSYFDHGPLVRYREARETKGLPPSPLAERAFSAVTLVLQAMAIGGESRKSLPESLRRVPDFMAGDAPIFAEWGQARLFDAFLHRPTASGPEPIPPLQLPSLGGGDLLRFRPSSRFRLDPEGTMILLTWGEGEAATIDEDLKAIGLSSRGYQADMDAWVKDEILSRAMSRIHRLYWRNADGTPIPGVSFDVTVGTELPEGAKSHKVWRVTIAGDHPEAGGQAFPPNRAVTYSTFIRRTMYEQHALEPALHRPDYPFFTGRYEWGTSLEQNLRHDRIRSLIDGFAGAIAMTTVHECGHLGGCGHDTTSPRSIMNVAEGGGLEPSWAEWIPAHVRTLELRLGRAERSRR
jgi:ABC-type branched-subunit amino acid transport system substrate-binding protein